MSKFTLKLIIATLFVSPVLSVQAQRVVTILEIEGKSVPSSQLQDPRTLNNKTTIASDIFEADGLFNFNKSNIRDLNYRQNDFQRLANIAIQGNYYVRVDAFADELGSQQYNKNLSQRRAKSVMEMLSQYYGINRAKISYTGWGENYPVVQCDTSKESLRYDRENVIDCLAPNRRVMVSVIKG